MKRKDFEMLEANGVRVFGDLDSRANCPSEAIEQASLVNWLRREYPSGIGALVVHIENEGKLSGGQFHQMRKRRAMGMTKGAADIIIPAGVSFVCEMKRTNYTKSKWQDGQIEYLINAAAAGSFACVALGFSAGKEAILQWQKKRES